MHPVRVAVVGLGGMGRAHLDVLAELAPWAEVDALADVAPTALAAAAARLPGATAYADPLDCIASADVDAVLVASSDDTHAALVTACLERGLPVLCEKPMTTTVADAVAVVERERATGRRLVQVGFMRRFDPDYLWLRERLLAGDVGEAMVVSHRNHNPAGAVPFDSAQLVASSATHDLDLTWWLLGSTPREVRCEEVVRSGARAVRLTVRTASGALAVSDVAAGPGLPYDIDTEVMGSAGVLRTGGPPTLTRQAGAAAASHLPADWVTRFAAAYRAQAVAWLRSLAPGEPAQAQAQPPEAEPAGAGAEDGLANAVVVAAALEALRSGRPEPVSWPGRAGPG